MSKAKDAWNHPGWKQAAEDYAAERPPTDPRITGSSFEDMCRKADELQQLKPKPGKPAEQTPQSTLDAALYVFRLGDEQRLKDWLNRKSQQDRVAIAAHIKQIIRRKS